MRRIVVFLDADSWDDVMEDAALIASSSLLLSGGIRRDVEVFLTLRSPGGYEWLRLLGWGLRNLRPDVESSVGLLRSLLRRPRSRGHEVGSGVPGVVGMLVDVSEGCREPKVPVGAMDVTLVYNGRGEYGETRYCLPVPEPPLDMPEIVAATNILMDNIPGSG